MSNRGAYSTKERMPSEGKRCCYSLEDCTWLAFTHEVSRCTALQAVEGLWFINPRTSSFHSYVRGYSWCCLPDSYIIDIWGLKDRHLLYLLGVAPTALTKKIIIVTALTDCPVRYRTFGAPQITSASEQIRYIRFLFSFSNTECTKETKAFFAEAQQAEASRPIACRFAPRRGKVCS